MTLPTSPSPSKKSQRVEIAYQASEMKLLLNEAYKDGWYVQSITANDYSWIAVLTK